MATAVILPKIEMAQKKATIIEWLTNEGDEVKKGDPLLAVETDKVTMEVEAPASGLLAGIRGEPGDEVPVTETIGYILEPGEALPGESEDGTVAAEQTRSQYPEEPGAEVDATPVAKRMAAAEGVSLGTLSGTGPQGRITKSDVETALESAPSIGTVSSKVRATPSARRIAREEQVDLSAISGTGPRGRVQADDVRAFAEARQEARAPGAEVVPLEGMRRTVAERMTRSYQSAPHIVIGVDVDMGAFERTRESLNARAEKEGEPRASITALLVKVVAWALKRHPWLNSTLQDEEIHLLPEINVGVAVALEEGLIVPVVKDADEKTVRQIAAELRELVDRARGGRLRPSDVTGGTFTVSNLGSFGIEEFKAIINPPEAAILAVGAIRSTLVPDADGEPVVRLMMRVTLSADHRIVDGALAARFLSDLRRAVQEPALLLL